VVREALDSALPRLREMLDNQEMNLVDVDISEHSFSDHRQASHSQEETNGLDNDEGIVVNDADLIVNERALSVGEGLVDYYA